VKRSLAKRSQIAATGYSSPPSSARRGISKRVSSRAWMVRVRTAGAPSKVHCSACVPITSTCITCSGRHDPSCSQASPDRGRAIGGLDLQSGSLVAYSPLGRGMLTGRLIEAVALAQSCTPAQIALAWVIANLGACDVELSHADRITLDALAARVLGHRYDTWGMAGINR